LRYKLIVSNTNSYLTLMAIMS